MNFDPGCIDVHDFLECLEIENVRQATENEVLLSCPFPAHGGGDENPSCYMNVHTTAFFCHSCHEKGNALHFTQKVLGVSPLSAIRMLKARYSPAGIDPDARSIVDEVQKILNAAQSEVSINEAIPEEVLENFEMDWFAAFSAWEDGAGFPGADYMFERGFTPETLDAWQFGYDPASNRIVFPARNDQGAIVGFKGRAWQEGHKPKYLILGDRPNRSARYGFRPYLKSLVVFGLHEAVQTNIDLDGEAPNDLILCEGELNAVALWQMGYRNAVAVAGSEFSAEQARLIRFYADSVTIFFDSDDAGRSGESEIIRALRDFMPVAVVGDHEGDPASMGPSEVSATLASATSHLVRELLRSH